MASTVAVIGITAALTASTMAPSTAAATSRPTASPVARASAYAFGAWIKKPEDVGRLSKMMGRQMTSVRVYYDAVPNSWESDPKLAAVPIGGTVSLSFTRGSPAQVRSFLAGHPRATKCYASYFIEPEPVFATRARQAQYRQGWTGYGPAIRDAGCIPMLTIRSWTMHAKSGRDWHAWYPKGSVDALGFDSYNHIAVDGLYPPPGEFISLFVAASRETGLPWAMPEVGSFTTTRGPLTPASRAAWAHGLAVSAASDRGFLFADWWDSRGADPRMDFTIDPTLARAWHA